MPKAREGRIVITNQGPDRKDAQKELPLRIAVVESLSQGKSKEEFSERKPVSVTHRNLGSRMRSFGASVDISVKNHLSDEEGAEIPVSIEFDGMKSFTPDAVIDKVPELKRLKELRAALTELKGPLGSKPEFRKRIEALLGDPEKVAMLLATVSGDDSEPTPANVEVNAPESH